MNVAAVARMMFGPAARQKAILVLGAFFDDSGVHSASPAITIGGVLGTSDQWDAFAVAWEALLANPLSGKPPLKAFHLSPCRAGDGEFRDYNEAERNRITYLFRRIILDTDLVTVAAVIDKAAWDELITNELVPNKPDALEFCFVKCVDTIIDFIRSRMRGEQIMLFFDQGTRLKLEQWARFYKMQSEKYPEIASITFAPVPKVAALQAADMIATESFYYGRAWLRDGNDAKASPHFREFLDRKLSLGLIFGREQIQEMVERIRRGEARSI